LRDPLDQSEVTAATADQIAPAHNESAPCAYFKTTDGISAEQIHALKALHEQFAGKFSSTLAEYLHTAVDVSVAKIEQLTCDQFVRSLSNHTCIYLLKAQGMEGSLCLELGPMIVYPIIARMLGGAKADPFIPQRPLTKIEQHLVQRVIIMAVRCLSEIWSSLTPVTFAVEDFQCVPQLKWIVPPSQAVVVLAFQFQMDNRSGTMHLCIPSAILEPIRTLLATPAPRPMPDDGIVNPTLVADSKPVEIRGLLAQTTISASKLHDLEVGDVITTDKRAGADILLQVDGQEQFCGKIVKFRGNRAIHITGAFQCSVNKPEIKSPGEQS